MPEGHVIHRLAQRYRDIFADRAVAVSSPQGRFAESAARLNGQTVTTTDAHGKQLFLGFGSHGWVRIHLGLYGKVTFGDPPVPEPVGAIRLRMVSDNGYADLRGPTVCELIVPAEKQSVHDRLGPDPLRADADPERAWRRVSRSRVSIGSLLMDQAVIAGVGNIYRCEVLFRHGIDPYLPGRKLSHEDWDAIWADLVALMREGVHTGRIDTVYPEHLPEAMGRPPRVDDHGGEVYVYRRAGQLCHVCGTDVLSAVVTARNLFWCPICQKR